VVSLVVDASMTLSWYFEDEQTPAGLQLLREVAAEGAVVPSFWRLEVASGFQTALRRKRITAAFRDASLLDLRTLPISIDAETDRYAWTTTLHLADRFTLTVYDAAYLELADRLDLPLASTDGQVCIAATRLGVSLLGQE
jgi:predicted nucleic acid-binding protein